MSLIGFSSSTAALEAFREAPQRFDIVLTDETMPELVGTELARRDSTAAARHPHRADERLQRYAIASSVRAQSGSAKSCASRCRARTSRSVSGASYPVHPDSLLRQRAEYVVGRDSRRLATSA